jgi:uncharacterized protein YegP (UPF0339 family)
MKNTHKRHSERHQIEQVTIEREVLSEDHSNEGKYEILKSIENNQFYFHLKAGNGKVIFSSEGYKRKQKVFVCIESIKKNANSPVIDLTSEQEV